MAGTKRKLKEYALYDGDEFIDIGTADELSKKHGYTKSYLYEIMSSSRRGKTKKVLVKLD